MSRVLRRKVTYNHIPRDTYAALGFPGARDLDDMFEFLRVHLPNRRAEIAQCRRLYPSMQTFEAWLQANVEGFAVVFGSVEMERLFAAPTGRSVNHFSQPLLFVESWMAPRRARFLRHPGTKLDRDVTAQVGPLIVLERAANLAGGLNKDG